MTMRIGLILLLCLPAGAPLLADLLAMPRAVLIVSPASQRL